MPLAPLRRAACKRATGPARVRGNLTPRRRRRGSVRLPSIARLRRRGRCQRRGGRCGGGHQRHVAVGAHLRTNLTAVGSTVLGGTGTGAVQVPAVGTAPAARDSARYRRSCSVLPPGLLQKLETVVVVAAAAAPAAAAARSTQRSAA
eukprot:scaffold772_cov361-Prasinococcus_capsulatus_cf.AAC.4